MLDETKLEKMAEQVDEIHGLLFPPVRERPSRAEMPATLIDRITEELTYRRRATVKELAECLQAKPESVRVSLYALLRRGDAARVGRSIWASTHTGKE